MIILPPVSDLSSRADCRLLDSARLMLLSLSAQLPRSPDNSIFAVVIVNSLLAEPLKVRMSFT